MFMLGVFLLNSALDSTHVLNSYNALDVIQLCRLDYLGLCLFDRSSPHAQEKCMDLARPPSDVNAYRLFLQLRNTPDESAEPALACISRSAS